MSLLLKVYTFTGALSFNPASATVLTAVDTCAPGGGLRAFRCLCRSPRRHWPRRSRHDHRQRGHFRHGHLYRLSAWHAWPARPCQPAGRALHLCQRVARRRPAFAWLQQHSLCFPCRRLQGFGTAQCHIDDLTAVAKRWKVMQLRCKTSDPYMHVQSSRCSGSHLSCPP